MKFEFEEFAKMLDTYTGVDTINVIGVTFDSSLLRYKG